jgi:hypothetical protein
MKWPFCVHRWEAIGAQKMEYNFFNKRTGATVGIGNPTTELLERCTVCGTHRTKSLAGHWTLEQLKAA